MALIQLRESAAIQKFPGRVEVPGVARRLSDHMEHDGPQVGQPPLGTAGACSERFVGQLIILSALYQTGPLALSHSPTRAQAGGQADGHVAA